MKKVVKIMALFAAGLIGSSSIWAFDTDISLYNEMNSAYNSRFYPGTAQYADRLISEFPDSVFAATAYAVKGECLVRTNQFAEAEETLKSGYKAADEKSAVQQTCVYWLGRCYELEKKYDEALIFYYDYCKKSGQSGKYYPSAVLNAGRVFYFQEDFKNAVSQLEYVISNGKKYERISWEDSLLKLADSYNKSGSPEKTVSLYSKISQNQTGPKTWWLLTEYTGDAYVLLRQYKKGYELFCQVLACPEKPLAANALKKAYNVSSEHKSEVGTDPGTVLSSAQANLSDSSDLLSEFWTRMGTDAFNEGDYKKASGYFDQAEKTAKPEIVEFIQTYRSEIALTKNPDEKTAVQAEKILCDAEKNLNLNENSTYFQQFNKLHIKYECLIKDFEKAKNRMAAVKELDYNTKYYLAMAFYNCGDYDESAKLLENSNTMLYALTLARQQKLKESAQVFEQVDDSSKLSDKQRLNYAKVLLYSGRYRESQIEAAKCSQNEAKYILGLAQFNTRSWKYSEENFQDFLKNGSTDKTAMSYALFYLGYSQYRLGKNEEAYKNLNSFCEKYPDHELIWNGRITAANAAVQYERYDLAAKQAENAVKIARNEADRYESVLLCSEIYVDDENYDKAVKLLSPYTQVKNEFGMKCQFQIARIYEKQKLLNEADKIYSKVAQDFSGNKLADEAFYRRGELYYSQEKYDEALKRFSEYSRKYPSGNFADASSFYSADCLSHTGKKDRAILQYQSLIKNFPESTYVYTASKNLMELYRSSGKYDEALKTASFLTEKYGEQANTDGIPEAVSQLKKLAAGSSEEIVAQENLYAANGKSKTAAGRSSGTELVRLYVEKSDFVKDGINLALEILPLQEKNSDKEANGAAQNAFILAKYYKQQKNNEKATDYYLKAAKYYKMSSLSDEGASCLYEVWDSYISLDRTADAEAVAKQLKELYPDSKYAKALK